MKWPLDRAIIRPLVSCRAPALSNGAPVHYFEDWAYSLSPYASVHAGMEVQIFGTAKSKETRAAQRFFAERRAKVHFVDLKERAASRGELQKWAQKHGVTALIDKTSRRYAELGLGVARMDDARWLDKLVEEPLLLVMPLVRWQHKVTIGDAADEWAQWIQLEKGS
ncbi:MAG: arsenate reductase [Gemmatimonadetes bacterium]|nr:arsenate reductase [Gemmatimonadota bacterium]